MKDRYRPCVGIVLVNDAGLVFAGRRPEFPDAWQMPQGGIDPGEAPLRAARRELAEETAVTAAEVLAETEGWLRYDLPSEIAGRIWRGRYRGQKQKWFLMRFLGQDADVDLDHHQREFAEWRWMAPSDIVDRIIAFKRPVYEAVFDAFDDPIARLREPSRIDPVRT